MYTCTTCAQVLRDFCKHIESWNICKIRISITVFRCCIPVLEALYVMFRVGKGMCETHKILKKNNN